MPKSKTYLLIIVVVFFFGFLFFFAQPQTKQKENLADQGENQKSQETPLEIFSMAGVVSEVNEKEGYLLVKRSGEEKAIKVLLNDKTKVIQLKFPFDLKNPPKEASFTPEKIPITLGDIKKGDNVLIEADINIYGKAEFDNVSRVQVLP